MRVTVNRGACCHVAGDIDFDKHNNLWLPTGDDSAAGSGDAGNWGQSIDQRTDENQTVRVTNATGGTFTLTFNGQTTAPLAFNSTAAQIAAALAALSNIGTANIQATGGPVNTANVLVTWKGTFEEQDVATLTSDATGLTGTTPTITIGVGAGAGGSNTSARQGGLWRMPAADSGRSALNTNDLRGKVLRIKVKDATSRRPTSTRPTSAPAARTRSRPGTCSRSSAGMPQAKTRPEIYAMGFRNPFRLQVDENDVAYVSDYSPDSQTPQQFHGPPGVGPLRDRPAPGQLRLAVLLQAEPAGVPVEREPAGADEPRQPPAGARPGTTPQPYDCGNPAGVPNNDYWNLNGGPSVQPGLAVTPPLTEPDVWYSYRDNNAATPLGTPCFDVLRAGRADRTRRYRARPPRARACSRSCSPAAWARTGSPSTTTTRRTRTRRSSRRTTTTR